MFKKPMPSPRRKTLINQTDSPPSFHTNPKIPEEVLRDVYTPKSSSLRKKPELKGELIKYDNEILSPVAKFTADIIGNLAKDSNYGELKFHNGLTLTPLPSRSKLFASIPRKTHLEGQSNTVSFLPPNLKSADNEQIEIIYSNDYVYENCQNHVVQGFSKEYSKIQLKPNKVVDTNVEEHQEQEKPKNEGKETKEEDYYNFQDISLRKPKIQLKSEQKRKEAKEEMKKRAMQDEMGEGNEECSEEFYYNVQDGLKSREEQSKDRKKREKEEEKGRLEEQKEVKSGDADDEKEKKSVEKNKEGEEDVYRRGEHVYEPLKYFEEVAPSNVLKPVEAFNMQGPPPPPVPPRRKEEAKFQTGSCSNYLTFTIKKFLDSEKDYIDRIQKALKVSEELRRKGFSNEIILNYFILLKDVYKFHKQTLLKDFELCADNPTQVSACFVNHAPGFHVYIERQRLMPNKSDLSEFEKNILDERNVKPYINMTKERVSEYIRTLQYLRYNYNGICPKVTEAAVKVVENLSYQLEMIQKLKTVEDINSKFKECGEVYLDRTFKVSINGTTRRSYLVYLCENLIIFTVLKENGTYHYVQDIPTSKCYCCVRKPTSVFEIGIKGKKRFTMKAESQTVKRRWCQELQKVLAPDLFEET